MTVVTRFAPSPTGHLHIGGARTAIFNWLLAKSLGGVFRLRIEDTDRERSDDAMTEAILDSLTWLGLDWDGDPVFQSRRMDLYNEQIDRLVDEGKAYWCSCTTDEVDAMREKARAEGRKPKYDGSCRDRGLSAPREGEKMVVRFKTPLDGKTIYTDMVKGNVAWEHTELDDMILRRSDGSPTYNLAVVVDDHDMGVTHVLRGEDHISNTPRQILLYQALGYDVPTFGHVPLIHGKDKKKLSKRHGARSTTEYRDDGILPQALLNYLVRLGWAHGDQEIFSVEELVKLFTTDNLSRSAAAFDPDKLLWLNAQYIKDKPVDELAAMLKAMYAERGRETDVSFLATVVPHYQPRSKTLIEMADGAEFFVTPTQELEYDAKAVEKFLTPEAVELLKELRVLLEKLDGFDHDGLDACLNGLLDSKGLKFKAIAQPLRVALTGKTMSPGITDTLEVLGREESLARLDRALSL